MVWPHEGTVFFHAGLMMVLTWPEDPSLYTNLSPEWVFSNICVLFFIIPVSPLVSVDMLYMQYMPFTYYMSLSVYSLAGKTQLNHHISY